MDCDTGEWSDQRHRHKSFPFAKIIAAALCLLLLLLSLMLININSHAVNADDSQSNPARKSSPTPTVIGSSTVGASPTTSPTITPTPSPTVKPTSSPTVKPTNTAIATATATGTATATPSPGVTRTPSPGMTATATSSGNQTPSPVSGVPTTTNGGGNGGDNGNGTPPALPQGGLFGMSLLSLLIGLLIFLGIVGVIFLSLGQLRKRLLPNPAPQLNLAPSGAQPWSRERPESQHSITDVPGNGHASPYPNVQGAMYRGGDRGSMPTADLGFPPNTSNNSNIGFPPLPPNTPPATGFYATNGPIPATGEVKPPLRHIPASIKLQALESSGRQQQNLNWNSEQETGQ